MEAQTAALFGALLSSFTLSFALTRRKVSGPVWYLSVCAGVAFLMLALMARYGGAWFMARPAGGGQVLLFLCGAVVIGRESGEGFNTLA
jgi:hypothetical protein